MLSHLSSVRLCDLIDCSPSGSGDSPGKNTGKGSHFLLQGIFLTQEDHSEGKSQGIFIFSFLGNLHMVLHSDCINLHSTKNLEGSFFSIPSAALAVCRFFADGHSDWCEMIPYHSLIWISLVTKGPSSQGYCFPSSHVWM